MLQNNQENGLKDRMSPGVAIAGYVMVIVIIAVLFLLAAPVSG